MSEPIVEIRNLRFSRGSRVILDDISLTIPKGQIVAVMGPSGVGKTTILKLIAGQLTPDSGTVSLFGQNLAELNRRELFKLRERTGFMLQNGALFTDLTVFENIATPLREHTDLPDALVRRLVMTKLSAVGLGGTEELMPQELSGGMARRVALARAIVLDPGLMLFDEPLTGLDPIAISTVRRLIREANDALGMTSIIVSHNVAQMRELVDYCIIITEGRIAGEDTPEALCASDDPAVNQFMNGTVEGPIPFNYANKDSWSLTGRA